MTEKKNREKNREKRSKSKDAKIVKTVHHYWYHTSKPIKPKHLKYLKPHELQKNRTQGAADNYPYKKLYRSRRDNWLGGVCGGMAEYFNKDPVLIRILWVVLTLVTFGIGIIAYILFWIFVDKYPDYYRLPPVVNDTNGNKANAIHYHYHERSF